MHFPGVCLHLAESSWVWFSFDRQWHRVRCACECMFVKSVQAIRCSGKMMANAGSFRTVFKIMVPPQKPRIGLQPPFSRSFHTLVYSMRYFTHRLSLYFVCIHTLTRQSIHAHTHTHTHVTWNMQCPADFPEQKITKLGLVKNRIRFICSLCLFALIIFRFVFGFRASLAVVSFFSIYNAAQSHLKQVQTSSLIRYYIASFMGKNDLTVNGWFCWFKVRPTDTWSQQ